MTGAMPPLTRVSASPDGVSSTLVLKNHHFNNFLKKRVREKPASGGSSREIYRMFPKRSTRSDLRGKILGSSYKEHCPTSATRYHEENPQ